MIDKRAGSLTEVLSQIKDGSTIMIGGFGTAGQPAELIDGLIELGVKDLVIVNNNAGNGDYGLAKLLKSGAVRKIICSFPRQSDSWVFDELYHAGKIELELVPQGNLACRIQAAGMGLGAVFTPTGFGTLLADGKETRHIDGKDYVLEYPIKADFALIKAHQGDRWGNLVYRKSARNFGPIMAMAADVTIAQVSEIAELGQLDPEHIITPGIFERVAQDIPDGAYVNLGIGLPTKISKYLPSDKDVFLHSENGLLAFGPPPAKGEEDPELINAGKEFVTMLTGGSFFHHGDSFAMMRGGHLDIAVLGAFQIAENGDLANWHTGAPDAIPAVGGAMDLAVGAKKVFITTDHVTKQGEPKIVAELTYPVTPDGLKVIEKVAGLSFEELQSMTGAQLVDATQG